jgi:hypothetical protein
MSNYKQIDNNFTIQHVATGQTFILRNTGLRVFSESYTSDWNEQSVFGRMDPILAYKGTRRDLSLELIIDGPTGEPNQAAADVIKQTNLDQAEMMASFMYPVYKEDSDTGVRYLKDPPLVRITYPGFLRGTTSSGQLCAIRSLSIDRGGSFHEVQSSTSNIATLEANQIILKFDLTPLHEYDMGWSVASSSAGSKSYKFGPSTDPDYYFSNLRLKAGTADD